MNKKQGHQMQFSLEKEHMKMDSSNPSYQSMDCIIKWQFYYNFSNLSQDVYRATEKTAEMS